MKEMYRMKGARALVYMPDKIVGAMKWEEQKRIR